MPSIEFHRPKSVEEAVSVLATRQGSRCIAGGQTLVAMMNAGLIETPSLVSLDAIAELRGIHFQSDGSVRIGAGTCHRDVAAHTELRNSHRVVREAASVIAHPAIRNFGTLGGALAHGDPASDYPTAVVAADGKIEIAGPQGRRSLAASEFFLDYFTTALESGEMVTALVLPPASEGSVGHYLKFARVDGDYAIVSLGVTLTLRDGICTHARVAAGGLGPTPIWSVEAEAALCGMSCDDSAVTTAARHLVEHADPVDDVRGSGEYRRALVPALLHRAIRNAMQSLKRGADS